MTTPAFEADLKSFVQERGLNKDGKFLELTTLKGYTDFIRRWHVATGAETPTLGNSKPFVIQLADTSPSSAQFAYRALKRYSAWLAHFMEQADPLASWKINVSPEPIRTPVASMADLTALLATCDLNSKTGPRDHAIISVLAYTGMRRSEVARMAWDDVDLMSGTITIPKTKTKKPRVVQMPTVAQKSLRRYMRTCAVLKPHVWQTHLYRALTSNGIQQMLRDRSQEAGVNVPAHSLRRFYAVAWLSADGSQAYLQKQAGWTDGRMVARYVSKLAEVESGKEALRIFG